MAVLAMFYGQAIRDITGGTINLMNDTFKAALCAGYVPDQDAHHYRTSFVSTEVTQGGTNSGYTTGGVTLTRTTGSITYDAASNEARFDFDDPAWTSANFGASSMVVYKSRGGTSTADELVMYVEFGGTSTVSNGTFSYQVPATGAGYFLVGTLA